MTDAVIENMLDNNPLSGFSVYTHVQSRFIIHLGEELILADFRNEASIDVEKFNLEYGKFWLWLLGAYEVIRTMADPRNRKCFRPDLLVKIRDIKESISFIRIPFAKQQLENKKDRQGIAIYAELSVVDFGLHTDQLVFEIDGQRVGHKDVIRSVLKFFSEIERAMILKEMSFRMRRLA